MSLFNPHITIDQLPVDVLLEIIIAYKRSFEEILDGDGAAGRWTYDYRWIKITHVCHYWRTVALSSPCLWTSVYVPPAPLEWADELVRRAQKAPLVLSLMEELNDDHFRRFLGPDSTITLVKRLQTCFRSFGPPAAPDYPPSIFDHLEALTLENDSRRLLEHPLLEYFATHLRQLRFLSVHRCPWDARLLHDSLTNLTLDDPLIYGGNVKWKEVCDALASLTQLEHLSLNRAFRGPVEGGHEFSYPRLRSLELLWDTPREYHWFLDSVSCPATTHLHMKTQGTGEDKEEGYIASLIDILSQFLSNIPRQHHSLHISGANEHFRVILGSNGSNHFDVDLSCQIPLDATTQMFNSIHTNTIRHLDLIYFAPPRSIIQTIATLPVLHSMELWDADSVDILHAFQTSIPILSCSCAVNADRLKATDQVPQPQICESCSRSWNKYFPSLRVLYYNGSLAEHQSLDVDVMALFKRLLYICDFAGHRMERLSLDADILSAPSRWMAELEPLCDAFEIR